MLNSNVDLDVDSNTRRLLVERVLELGWSMHDAAKAAGVWIRSGWRRTRRQ